MLIDYIVGKIGFLGDDYFVIENNGIGYRINTSSNTLQRVSDNREEQKIHTNLIVREDGMYLYGFDTEEEMSVFKLLITVSKVGPKVASGILSGLTPIKIQRAILTKDLDTLCKAPGVGKKTAERIVLELKDKISGQAFEDDDIHTTGVISGYDEAIEALTSLGYTKYEIEKVLRGSVTEDMQVEEIIKIGLKKLSF